MAVSTCIKSGEHGFELVLFTPLGGSHISRWFSFARSSRFRWRLLAFCTWFSEFEVGPRTNQRRYEGLPRCHGANGVMATGLVVARQVLSSACIKSAARPPIVQSSGANLPYLRAPADVADGNAQPKLKNPQPISRCGHGIFAMMTMYW